MTTGEEFEEYPNLQATLEGRVAGMLNDWIAIRGELFNLFEANRRQEEKIERLKEILRKCHQAILELCPDMDIEYGDELKELVGEK